MRRKLFLILNLISLSVVSACATAPPPPPREETCLLRAPTSFPPADPGALECFDPAAAVKGFELPFSAADKFICKPPAGQKEYDLYLKLRGI